MHMHPSKNILYSLKIPHLVVWYSFGHNRLFPVISNCFVLPKRAPNKLVKQYYTSINTYELCDSNFFVTDCKKMKCSIYLFLTHLKENCCCVRCCKMIFAPVQSLIYLVKCKASSISQLAHQNVTFYIYTKHSLKI